MATALWIALSNIKGVGVKTIKKIYDYYPNLTEKYLSENREEISDAINNSKLSEKISDESYLKYVIEDAKQQIEFHNNKEIHVIDIASEYYPKLLRLIDDPPVILYCKGNLELLKDDKKIAVVGTRKPTERGYKAAVRISEQFSKRDYIIVSGLALGIDTAGHLGALNADGETIAVLASSLDKVYPKENIDFANEIVNKKGLLISEIPLGGKTFRNSFVLRDRIQSGLSIGVCPVQTPLKSGTQHTIKYAQNQERVLFVPKPLESREIEATQGVYYLLDNDLAEEIADENDYDKITSRLTSTLEKLNNKNIEKQNEINQTIKKSNQTEVIEQLNIFDLKE